MTEDNTPLPFSNMETSAPWASEGSFTQSESLRIGSKLQVLFPIKCAPHTYNFYIFHIIAKFQGLHWKFISEDTRGLQYIFFTIPKVLSTIMHIVLFNIIYLEDINGATIVRYFLIKMTSHMCLKTILRIHCVQQERIIHAFELKGFFC